MANVTINNLPTANTIDATQDFIPIYTASGLSTQKINRNTFLGLASAPVGLTDSQSLTNKTLTSPAISNPVLSGTITGTYTIGGTATFPASLVTLTGSQTLTNKVLTSPTINGPTITNATLSADAITGFSTANNGTIYGVAVTGGLISGTSLTTGSITTTQLANNAVAANNIATTAITLGYTKITAGVTPTTPTSVTQVTGLTQAVTIPAGGRNLKITMYTPALSNSNVNASITLSIWDGTVGSGTQLQSWTHISGIDAGAGIGVYMVAIVQAPAAGAKTYNIGATASAGSPTVAASATAPAFILVEII